MSSLKEFLKQYPSFLDKTEDSNFYKHVEIYNKQRLELLQQLNNIRLSKNIERPIQIQKSQNTHNTAVYYFYIYLDDIKSVKIIREDTNGEVIEEKQYNEKGHSKAFFRYQVYSQDIIPQSRFHVIVETYNEYTYEKGYPENDTIMGNIYDHDTNLDILGKILGVNRYNHISVNESEYPYTIPPYFDGATEDDYYYQERIKAYISRFAYYYDISENQYDALPLLEFWKYYGFNPLMKNRKRLLSSQEGVNYITDWTSYDDDDTFYSPVDAPVSTVYDTGVDPLSSVRYQIQSILNMDRLEEVEPVTLNLDIHIDKVSCMVGDSVTVTGVVTDVDGNPMYGIPVDLYVNGTAINKDITNSKNSSITNNEGTIIFEYTPNTTGNVSLYCSVSKTDVYGACVSSTMSITVVEEDKAVEILSNISNWVASTSGVNNAEAYTSTHGYAGIKLTATGRTVLNQYFTDKTAYTLEFDMLLNKDNRQGIYFNQEPSTETDHIWFGTDVGNTLWNDETTLSKNYFTTGTHHFKLVRDGSTAKWIIDDEEVYTYTGMGRNCIGFVIWGSGWLAAYNFRFTSP